MSLKSKVISASKWSAFSEIASKSITPLVFVILARLLGPEDFGVAAVALILITFSQIFWDAGLKKALIQYEGDIDKASNIVFWTNVLISIIIYIVLFLSACFIAHLFEDARIEAVIKVQGIQIILSSLSSVHIALLQRNFNFKLLFLVRLVTTAAPAFASLPLAWMGFGYWALVSGSLLGSIAQFFSLWSLSSWKPKLIYDKGIAKKMLSFGGWITLDSLLVWAVQRIPLVLVGKYLGINYLGLYEAGKRLVEMIFSLVLSPLFPVLFSTYSRLQKDRHKLKAMIEKVTRFFVLFSVILTLSLVLNSQEIGELVFGIKWEGISTVITLLALSNGVSWFVGAFPESYRAIGRPDISSKLLAFHLLYSTIIYIFCLSKGFYEFLLSRCFVACFTAVISSFIVRKVYSFHLLPFARYLIKYLTIAIGAYLLAIYPIKYVNGSLLILIKQTTISIFFVLSLLLIVDRENLFEVIGLIKSSFTFSQND